MTNLPKTYTEPKIRVQSYFYGFLVIVTSRAKYVTYDAFGTESVRVFEKRTYYVDVYYM